MPLGDYVESAVDTGISFDKCHVRSARRVRASTRSIKRRAVAIDSDATTRVTHQLRRHERHIPRSTSDIKNALSLGRLPHLRKSIASVRGRIGTAPRTGAIQRWSARGRMLLDLKSFDSRTQFLRSEFGRGGTDALGARDAGVTGRAPE
jgi:hypothetical protein